MPQTTHSQSFVDTDVREVFASHSVEETQAVQKKINYEIERKREELRMLVGERYRDLIDAADTIAIMRTSSVSVSKKLAALRTTFNALPDGLKEVEDGRKRHVEKKLTRDELEISMELKLSLDIPSAIQNCMEQEALIPALHMTLLFSRWLARKEEQYKWKVLASTRGDLTNSANTVLNNISDFCNAEIIASISSYQKIAECILVKHILTNSSVSTILSEWLTQKVQSCQRELGRTHSEGILNLVTSTLEAAYFIFVEPNLYNSTTKTINTFQIDPSTFGLRFTPRIMTEYNDSVLPIEESLSLNILSGIILREFITPLKMALDSDEKYLTQLVTLVQLQEYRRTSLELFRDRCDGFMRIVLGQSTSIWTHVFYPAFQRWAEEIAQREIQDIVVFLQKIGYPKFMLVDGNFDVIAFIWKANVVVNTDNSAGDDNMKMKCLTPSLSQLCEDLEFRFSELLIDFQTMGDQSLKEFISTKLLESINIFLCTTGSGSNEDHPTFNEKSNSSFGRFTTGLIDLCPTLWKILEKNDGIRLKEDLLSQSEKCWENWSAILLETFNSHLAEKMSSLEANCITSFMPLGEVYETENAESGEKFAPSVRVPVELTHSLHSLLFSICLELSKVGPQCIPKTVKDALRIKLAKNIVTYYEKLSTVNGSQAITPQTSIQFIFDLKFIQWFHPSLRGVSDDVVLKLKSVIDPFDWDIVYTRMTANLKRFLFENQLVLGLLFSEDSHGFIAQNFKTKQSLHFPTLTRNLLYNQLPLLPL